MGNRCQIWRKNKGARAEIWDLEVGELQEELDALDALPPERRDQERLAALERDKERADVDLQEAQAAVGLVEVVTHSPS